MTANPKMMSSTLEDYVNSVDIEMMLNNKINTGNSPKSIVFSPDMKKAHINNLKDCSTWVFDAKNHSLEQTINYEKTLIKLYDKKEQYNSFEEKPVESCFSHEGQRLWTSLHNANGIIVQDTKGELLSLKKQTGTKKATLKNLLAGQKKIINLPFIKTGKTPKIIKLTPDGQRICVANWDSGTVSFIDSETGKNYGSINTGYAPRGIAFTNNSKIGFVANFFSHTISVFEVYTMKKIFDIKNVGKNPRHILIDKKGESMYVGFHGDGYIRQFDVEKKTIEDEVKIGGQIRTITATPNFKYLFADSYSRNEVVLINTKSMAVEQRIKSLYKPVGAAYNYKTKQLWVTNQGNATVSIFDVKEKQL